MQSFTKNTGTPQGTDSPAQGQGYYDKLTNENSIEEVAMELMGDRLTTKSGDVLYFDCPNHKSQSKRSLQVDSGKQVFNCNGCDKGGNVLHLVEFIQSKTVTTQVQGQMPESHVKARDWLADRAGIPRLSSLSASPEELAKIQKAETEKLRMYELLTTVANVYSDSLLENKAKLTLLQEQYGIKDTSVIQEFKIGYSDDAIDLEKILLDEGFSKKEIISSGLMIQIKGQSNLTAYFKNRLIFPYIMRDLVVYMTGRKTYETPDEPWEQGKYKKLPIHNDEKNKRISKHLSNSFLYNEDALRGRSESVVLAEGITDSIASHSKDFPTASLGTVHMSKTLLNRVTPKLKRFETVYVCFDTETSQVGQKNALKVAQTLEEEGVRVKIATLPLLENAEKIDINAFFLSGRMAEDFQELLDNARTPIEYRISQLPTKLESDEDFDDVRDALKLLTKFGPLVQDQHLRAIYEHTGKGCTLKVLQSEMKELAKAAESKPKYDHKESEPVKKVSEMSCKERIAFEQRLVKNATKEEKASIAAKVVMEFLLEKDATFYYDPSNNISMIQNDKQYVLNSSDKCERQEFESLMFRYSGQLSASNSGKCCIQALTHLAHLNGTKVKLHSWQHTDRRSNTVYMNLNNPEREIVKITPESINVIKNGDKKEGILLANSNKIKPIRYLSDVTIEEGARIFEELILKNLSCSDEDRIFFGAWLCTYPLIRFCGTTALARNTGFTSSGKTTAAKLFTTLLFGEPAQKVGTIASHYTDGAKHPILVLDNIESSELTTGLKLFLLTAGSEIRKEKRKSGTDTENVTEEVKTLVLTTGIEAAGGEFTELESRTITFHFNVKYQTDPSFVESRAITKIQDKRDVLLSWIFKKTQAVLKMIRENKLEQVMALINKAFPRHSKNRLNEHLGIMYLFMLAGEPEEQVEKNLNELHSTFAKQIQAFNAASRETSQDSNQIISAIYAIFNQWNIAVDQDSLDSPISKTETFTEKYQVSLQKKNKFTVLEKVKAGQLFLALRKIASDCRLPFDYKNARILVNRINNDLEILKAAGIKVNTKTRDSSNQILYTIKVRT